MKKIVYIVSTTIIIFALFYIITGYYQVYNKPIKSKHLLMEGWLPRTTIENAAQYIINNDIDSIWIFSFKKENRNHRNPGLSPNHKIMLEESTDKVDMAWSGMLIYEIPTNKIQYPDMLNISMYGTPVNNIYPHFKIFINDSLLKSGFVNDSDSVFSFSLKKYTPDKNFSLKIYFDNDAMIKDSDRNMFVTRVLIDSTNINKIASKKYYLLMNNDDSEFFDSGTEDIKRYLTDFGIEPDKIKIAETNNELLNNTLALSKKAGNFFKNSKIKDLNIYANSHHSGRTFLNFRNCIKKDIKIGCIATDSENDPDWFMFYENVDERISLFFSWVYWWFN